ncbi:hypothetical protein GW17_00058996 [Ensete ventricosum]|nr:hypothetical protein GW17_00058996 [Ensete ventricosum]
MSSFHVQFPSPPLLPCAAPSTIKGENRNFHRQIHQKLPSFTVHSFHHCCYHCSTLSLSVLLSSKASFAAATTIRSFLRHRHRRPKVSPSLSDRIPVRGPPATGAYRASPRMGTRQRLVFQRENEAMPRLPARGKGTASSSSSGMRRRLVYFF